MVLCQYSLRGSPRNTMASSVRVHLAGSAGLWGSRVAMLQCLRSPTILIARHDAWPLWRLVRLTRPEPFAGTGGEQLNGKQHAQDDEDRFHAAALESSALPEGRNDT